VLLVNTTGVDDGSWNRIDDDYSYSPNGQSPSLLAATVSLARQGIDCLNSDADQRLLDDDWTSNNECTIVLVVV
jgi:hypothetical protein